MLSTSASDAPHMEDSDQAETTETHSIKSNGAFIPCVLAVSIFQALTAFQAAKQQTKATQKFS